MSFEDDIEKGKTGGKAKPQVKMTLQRAVDMGEYDPEYLATFPEWHSLSRHLQFNFIKQAVENREKQLLMQYAEINNVLDFRLKPDMQKAAKNVMDQLKKIDKDREKLLMEYFKE